jgi:hypothetical protein
MTERVGIERWRWIGGLSYTTLDLAAALAWR